MKLRCAFEDFAENANTCQILLQRRRTKGGALRAKELRQLHQLRIVGKRVRYVIELLEPAYGVELRRDFSPVFTRFQDRLGDINDHVSASNFYRRLKSSTEQRDLRRALRKMIRMENETLETSVDEYRRWWSSERLHELDQSLHATLERDVTPLRIAEC